MGRMFVTVLYVGIIVCSEYTCIGLTKNAW